MINHNFSKLLYPKTSLLIIGLTLFNCFLFGQSHENSKTISIARPMSSEEVFNTVKDSIFTIEADDIHGDIIFSQSGVALTKNSVVSSNTILGSFANLSDIKSKAVARYRLRQGYRTYDVKKVYVNIKRDVSIFESDDLHSKPVQLEKFKKITEGQVVFAISYPKDQDETLTEAHIANIDSNKTINSIKTSLSLGMHASGGGLFNSNGKLVGIIDYNQYSTQNYAIPVSDIENVNVLFSGISNNNDYPEQKKSDAQVQVLTANISTFSEAASMKEQKLYIESDEQKYVSDAISKSELLGLYDVSSIPDAYDNWPSWRKNLASMELLRVVLSSANDSGLAKDEIVRLCIEDGRKMWSDIADRYCTQIPGATFTDLEGKERACPQPH